MPEILHFAPVAADEGGGLQALFHVPSQVLPDVAEGGEGVEARDAGKKSQNALGMFGGAFADDGGAAGALHFGKRLAFAGCGGGELLAFRFKICPPDSLRLLQGVAALPRCRWCSAAGSRPRVPRGHVAVASASAAAPAAAAGRGPARSQRPSSLSSG